MTITFKSTLREGAEFFDKVERQVPYATSVALNRTGDAVRQAWVSEIQRRLDRPTPYTLGSPRLIRSTKSRLEAKVDFKDSAGRGISAGQYLGPQVLGGARRRKRSEIALQRAGLPTGSYLVPGSGAQLDAYGNMGRGQLVRMISYLEAFGEQGYRANSTAKTRARMAKVATSEAGYRRINGVVYFASRGKGTMSGNRRQNLPAGIWRKTGTHGSDVKPVMLAVDAPTYTQRLPLYETADEIFGTRYEEEYASALDAAIASAR